MYEALSGESPDIYAVEACFGESIGFRGRSGRALLGRVGARLRQSRSLGAPGRTICR